MKQKLMHHTTMLLIVLFAVLSPAYVFSWDKQASSVKQKTRNLSAIRQELIDSTLKYEKQGDSKAAKNDLTGAISDYSHAILPIPRSTAKFDSRRKQQILLLKLARANLLLNGRKSVERFLVSDLPHPDEDSYIIIHALLGEYEETLRGMDRRHKLSLSKKTKEQLINKVKAAIADKNYSDIEKAFLLLRTIADEIGGFDYPSSYYEEMFRPDNKHLQKTFPQLFERYMAFSKIRETSHDNYEVLGIDFINRFPAHGLGYLLVAFSQWQQEKWQALTVSLDKATKNAPYFSDDLDRLLKSLMEHGHAEEAKKIAQRILATSPDNSKILEILFFADITLKNYPAAIDTFVRNETRFSKETQSVIPFLYLQNKDWPRAQQRFLELIGDKQIQGMCYVYLLAGQQEGFFSLNPEILKKLETFHQNVLQPDKELLRKFDHIIEKFKTGDFL